MGQGQHAKCPFWSNKSGPQRENDSIAPVPISSNLKNYKSGKKAKYYHPVSLKQGTNTDWSFYFYIFYFYLALHLLHYVFFDFIHVCFLSFLSCFFFVSEHSTSPTFYYVIIDNFISLIFKFLVCPIHTVAPWW